MKTAIVIVARPMLARQLIAHPQGLKIDNISVGRSEADDIFFYLEGGLGECLVA